jgi:amidase
MPSRRDVLRFAAAGGAQAAFGLAAASAADSAPTPMLTGSFKWEEASIADLRAAMDSGKQTASSITQDYLDWIAAVDKKGPAINAIIELSPDALGVAQRLDGQRLLDPPRGPLHGIPVLVKDNLDTHDRMMTTAGSLALLGSVPSQDSFVVQKLREAGAVLLGKTNLSEWANFRGNSSTSGWSGRGGLTRNPYALDRNPSGSSSGSAAAVAANFCAVAIGTETDGSIISPSTVCGIVGLKPTVGLVSRGGIVPISHSQDTAGPMGRSVRDVAILLGAIVGEDPRDPATKESAGKSHNDYTKFLDADGLRGARIGIARRMFRGRGKASQAIDAAIARMKELGAVLIDPLDIPSQGKLGNAEHEVLLYEFKHGINTYLASLGPRAPMRSLADLIAFNAKHADEELRYFGQETFIQAQEKGPLTEQTYLDAVERCRRFARKEGIDAVMDEHRLDAIVAPSGGPAGKTDLIYGDRDVGGSSSLAAVAGYPNITVPAGNVMGLPLGISFFGRAYSEPTLLKLAYAFEQATKARIAPKFLPTLG